MSYLGPVRFSVIGDRAKAARYFGIARNLLWRLQQRSEGVIQNRARYDLEDGTVIDILLAGLIASATIDVTGDERVGATMAYVALNTATPYTAVVDVELQKVRRTFTGLGQTIAMAVSHDGRYLFSINNARQLIKTNVKTYQAVGLTSAAPLSDLFMSPDGKRLHVRYTATGSPGAGGTYGGMLTYSTADLSLISSVPNQLFSSFAYRGAEHPVATTKVYLTVFGDGDGDDHPFGNPPSSDSSYTPNAIEVYDYTTGAFVAGEILVPYRVASGRGFRSVAITTNGLTAYACSSRPNTLPSGGSFTDTPALIRYNVKDGTLVRTGALLAGLELTGDVATDRGGAAYVAGVSDGIARRVSIVDNVVLPFPYRTATLTGFENVGRHIVSGPDRDPLPDDRVFYLSSVGKSLWAFKPGALKPDKKITLLDTPWTFALGKAPAKDIQK